MDKKLLILLILLSVSILGAFHNKIKERPDTERINEIAEQLTASKAWLNTFPPQFKGEMLSGDKFDLSENVGHRVIILNFFATWCGPCKEEMPELIQYYEKHKKEDFVLIGIDAEESKPVVNDFVKKMGITFPVMIDDGKIQELYGVEGYPTNVLIGTNGKIEFYDSGAIQNAEVAFDSFLESSKKVLKEHKGISREEYLAGLKHQEQGAKKKHSGEKEDELQGRARQIAESMDCVCGCNDKLLDCTCKTADSIKRKVKTMPLENKTDQEVILALNKEFCVGAKHD